MHLIPHVADQLWLCPYPVHLAGTRFDARMTVIRLSTGALLLHSPCEITPTIVDEISPLGAVAHILAPGNFHSLHVASAQAAFPKARTWVCPGTERRCRGIRYDSLLGDVAPTEWAGELDQVLVSGRIMREVAMFHRSSRTLILVDLIENFTDCTPHMGPALKFWFKYVMRMWNNPGPAPEYRLAWGDRQAVGRSLQRILAWDFDRIVLSHGDVIDSAARQVATAAWAGILKQRSH